jgi:hypothetical protein
MAFRLTVLEMSDQTTVRLAGRLGDNAVTPLHDAYDRARRAVVLDMSEVTGASDAALLLLRRLIREGVHLEGVSHYMTLLLADEEPPSIARPQRGRAQSRDRSRGSEGRRKGRS